MLHDTLDQFGATGLRYLKKLSRNILFSHVHSHLATEAVGPHGNEVDNATEAILGTDWELNAHGFFGETFFN